MLMTIWCCDRIVGCCLAIFARCTFCSSLVSLWSDLWCLTACIITVILVTTHECMSYPRCKTPPPGSTLRPSNHHLAVGQQFEQQHSILSAGWGTSVPSLPWGEARLWPPAWSARPAGWSRKQVTPGYRMQAFNGLPHASFTFQSRCRCNC